MVMFQERVSTRCRNACIAERSRVASGRFANPNSNPPAVIAEMHNDAIDVLTTCRTTPGCCLTSWLTMLVIGNLLEW